MDEALLNRQIEMEKRALDRGIARFNRNFDRAREGEAGNETEAGLFLMKQSLKPASDAIKTRIEAALGGRAGRKSTAALAVKDIEPDLLAYLTLNTVVSSVAVYKSRPLSNTVSAIAGALELELKMAAFEERSPALYGVIMDNLADRGSTPQHTRTVMNLSANRYGLEWEGWGQEDRLKIGTFLLDAVSPALDWLEIEHVMVGKNKSAPVVRASPALVEWLKSRNEQLAILRPVTMPMIVPPRLWKGLRGGGYRSDHILKAPLVKRMSKGHAERLKEADLSVVHTALNAIQETPWSINRDVLKVAEALWEAGADVGGMPNREDLPLPPKPHDIEENEEARKEWKRHAKRVYEMNVGARSQRILAAQILSVAEELQHEAAIYMPHNLDFRGRVYARPGGLNPQGNDLCRGLLQFSEAKPLGTHKAAGWLAIHGANCFGVDKVSHPERIDWVYAHYEEILAVAKNPIENRWWTEADSPWCFLAFCFEWRGFFDAGLAFESRLPIALDGSCNGLQHFSAMLRDPVGGAAVNLIPHEKPQDIYGKVAERVVERLKALVAEGGEDAWRAAEWVRFGIDRKITKRPVMVLPYGGTQSSCRDYVIQAVTERIKGGQENPFGDELIKNASWLGGQVWKSIGEVVVAATEAMEWLRKAARVATKAGVPLTWTTPSGFVAQQAYWAVKERRVQTRLHGSLVTFVTKEQTQRLDPHRQASGISPNFIHSMDAAALMLTVDECLNHGITSFAMIHDSYGTHACDTDVLGDCLRVVFVDIYSKDVLGALRDELDAAILDGDLPPLPPKGDLDLNQVLLSDFFFS